MKVTLAIVTSLDGRSTKGATADASTWASAEDQIAFRSCIASSDCIVMGSTTYEAVRTSIKPSPDKPRIVMTRTPERYASEEKPGLVFTADPPRTILEYARMRGYTSMLLASGATINAIFFDASLVDEVLITIEPWLFGTGNPLVAELQQATALRLLESQQLNSRGTLLLRYAVEKVRERPRTSSQ